VKWHSPVYSQTQDKGVQEIAQDKNVQETVPLN
jgi:hypothetical protein